MALLHLLLLNQLLELFLGVIRFAELKLWLCCLCELPEQVLNNMNETDEETVHTSLKHCNCEEHRLSIDTSVFYIPDVTNIRDINILQSCFQDNRFSHGCI